jgi:hypothetical protein
MCSGLSVLFSFTASGIHERWGLAQVEAFLTDLAVQGHVSASTQNQALSALLFLYKEVLAVDLPWLDSGSRYLRKLVLGIQAKQAAKITRPPMPAAPQPSCFPRFIANTGYKN